MYLLVTKQRNKHLEILNELFMNNSTGTTFSLQITSPQIYASFIQLPQTYLA